MKEEENAVLLLTAVLASPFMITMNVKFLAELQTGQQQGLHLDMLMK